jgi:3-deoxy-D-manno-octulosonate 8-phosphate phosphatase (KDO 8-P phosphatase)
MIKAVAMDVDGVLTDGHVWLDEDGRETKRVAFLDIMGVSRGRRAGLLFALVSGEAGPSLDKIAAKFGIEEVYSGCKDKAGALRDFSERHGLDHREVCFVGDDVNDIPALEMCGLAVTTADAHPAAKQRAALITSHSGGSGAVRELVDRLLQETEAETDDR